MTVACRLVHGPFDGDEGALLTTPRTIYATDCLDNHGRDRKGKKVPCDQGGVHWHGDPAPSQLAAVKETCSYKGLRCERYKKDREIDGTRTYVWADVKGAPVVTPGARERVPVGEKVG